MRLVPFFCALLALAFPAMAQSPGAYRAPLPSAHERIPPRVRGVLPDEFAPRYHESPADLEVWLAGPFPDASRSQRDPYRSRFTSERGVPSGLERGGGLDVRIKVVKRFWARK